MLGEETHTTPAVLHLTNQPSNPCTYKAGYNRYTYSECSDVACSSAVDIPDTSECFNISE